MKVRIETLEPFEKEFKRLRKRYSSLLDDYKKLVASLEENPDQGTDLGGGLRKLRMRIASKGKGKSGGARIITLTVKIDETMSEIDMVYIYDKADISNVPKDKIMGLLRQNGLL